MHGKGKVKYTNGRVQEGMWSDDKFIGWSQHCLNFLHVCENSFIEFDFYDCNYISLLYSKEEHYSTN
jgi:hypothetical protein